MTDDERFDLVRVKALPITPDGLREFANIMRESCGYDSDNMFHLGYQWHDKPHRHVSDMQDKILKAADRIEALEAALRKIFAVEDEHINAPKNHQEAVLWVTLAACVGIAEAALAGDKKDE
jgi:hypothetical protein